MARRDPAIAKESGRRIREAREARKWSQKDLSEAMGWKDTDGRQPVGALKPSAIGNYEQGSRRVNWEEAVALAKVFTEFPPAYFMAVISEAEAAVLSAMSKPPVRRQSIPFADGRPVPRRSRTLKS